MFQFEKFIENKFLLRFSILIWALFITNLWLPRNWGFMCNNDWDLTFATFEIAYKSVVDYHQWPAYNPFLAFGSDLNANPQSVHAGFLFLPVIAFGAFYGYKIALLMAILLGVHGFRKLLLSNGNTPTEALLLALFFCSSSYFGRHIMFAGHSNFLHFYLIPYLFYFLLQFKIHLKYKFLILPILILSQMITGGAPIVFIIACFTIVAWCIALKAIEKQDWKLIIGILTSIIMAIGMATWKISSVLNFWKSNPRLSEDNSSINLLVWLQSLMDFETDTGTHHQWHEISLGLGLLIPILVFMNYKQIKGLKIWLVIFGFFIWLSFGNIPNKFNPWYVLNQYFPVFSSLRAPMRFGFIIVFGLSIAFSNTIKLYRHNQLIYIILIAITLSNTLNFNSISRNHVFSKRYVSTEVMESKIGPLQIIKSEDKFKNQYEYIRSEACIINAYEPLHLSPISDTLESFILGGEIISHTINEFKIKSKDTILKLSLRHDNNWFTEPNQKSLKSKGGLIEIETLPNQVFDLKRHSSVSNTGIVISIIFLILSLLLPVLNIKRSKHQ